MEGESGSKMSSEKLQGSGNRGKTGLKKHWKTTEGDSGVMFFFNETARDWCKRKNMKNKNLAAIPGSFLFLAILAVEITHQARICDWVPTRSCVHATDHLTGH